MRVFLKRRYSRGKSMKLSLVVLFFVSLFLNTLRADERDRCTSWERQMTDMCLLAGETHIYWKRQCMEPCTEYDNDRDCGKEYFCFDENPNFMRRNCTQWVKAIDVTCLSHRGEFEQQWERSCQYGGVKTIWCSDENPNPVQR